MLSDAVFILGNVLLPVILIAVLGAVLQSFKPLDLKTLVSVSIYIFVPIYVFVRIFDSSIPFSEVARMAVVVMGSMAVVGIVLWGFLRGRGEPKSAASSAVVAAMFFNAGNLGIPVAELAFGEDGGRVQPLLMMFVGMSTFVIGYPLLARGQGKGWMSAIGAFLRLPYVYAILLAVLLRTLHVEIPAPVRSSLDRIAAGMIPVALFTLGAQVAQQARWPRWRLIAPVLVFKLLVMPIVAAFFVYCMGMWPFPGKVIILATTAPAAVNTLLIAIEADGDAELAADCVFWTTLISILTIPIALAIIRSILAM